MSSSNHKMLLKSINEVKREYAGSMEKTAEKWKNSELGWMFGGLPSRSRGTVVEKIIANYMEAKGYDVENPSDQEADKIICGRRLEIKSSSLWESNAYRFQQIRNQNYDFIILFGASPAEYHLWVMTKDEIMKAINDDYQGLSQQHGGSSARGDIPYWLKINPADIPPWLKDYGGTLADGLARVDEYLKNYQENTK